jgi:hypothetical protein
MHYTSYYYTFFPLLLMEKIICQKIVVYENILQGKKSFPSIFVKAMVVEMESTNGKSKLWFFQNFNFLESMTKTEMMELSQGSVMKEHKRDENVYLPHELSSRIYFLKQGKVKIVSFSREGRELIHGLLNAGEIFGELALAGEERRDSFAMHILPKGFTRIRHYSILKQLVKKECYSGITKAAWLTQIARKTAPGTPPVPQIQKRAVGYNFYL